MKVDGHRPTSPRQGRWHSRPPALLALAFALALPAGCATRADRPGPMAEPPRETLPSRSSAPEPGDPQRRAQVRLELATLYFGRGQHDVALDEVRQALAARPDMAEAHGLRGLILASMGNAAAAEESLLRAVALAPGDGSALHNHAWFLCQQGRFDEAERRFEAALAQPGYGDAARTLMAQGVCQARSGRTAQAERTLSRSFELDPASPVTAINLAEVLLQRGQAERARFYVRRIHATPEFVSAQSLWLLARLEHRLGNAEAAAEAGRQLQSRFAQSPEALRYERGRFDE